MDNLFESLEKAIADQNWYCVLIIAVGLPDICAYAAYQELRDDNKSRLRYEKWFNEYLLQTYTLAAINGAAFSMPPRVVLSGNDCYALRCAILHQGSRDINTQRAQEVLSRFSFTRPESHVPSLHKNTISGYGRDILQLQVDRFASDILSAARSWWSLISQDERRSIDKYIVTIHDSQTASDMGEFSSGIYFDSV